MSNKARLVFGAGMVALMVGAILIFSRLSSESLRKYPPFRGGYEASLR